MALTMQRPLQHTTFKFTGQSLFHDDDDEEEETIQCTKSNLEPYPLKIQSKNASASSVPLSPSALQDFEDKVPFREKTSSADIKSSRAPEETKSALQTVITVTYQDTLPVHIKKKDTQQLFLDDCGFSTTVKQRANMREEDDREDTDNPEGSANVISISSANQGNKAPLESPLNMNPYFVPDMPACLCAHSIGMPTSTEFSSSLTNALAKIKIFG